MPGTTPYPFDPTGLQASNRITGEQQAISPPNWNDFYFIVPQQAPFFRDGVVLRHVQSGRTLVEGIDYVCTHYFHDASLACAKPIYGSITICDRALSGILVFDSYQTIGGVWTRSPTEILEILSDRLHNPRITTFEQVVQMPVSFPVVDHEWNLIDLVGASELVDSIDSIADAVLVLAAGVADSHLNDKTNPHATTKAQVGLGNVDNFRSSSETEARAGELNTLFMTPLRVKQAIESLALAPLNVHINNTSNPHQTTKSQVGLGNVDNYLTANDLEAGEGQRNDRFMTPYRTRQSIEALVGNATNEHISSVENPHQTTKIHVGLGNVDNYLTASAIEAAEGQRNDRFMTALRVKQAIDALVLNFFTTHAANTSNPHSVTKTQVGLGNVNNYGTATAPEAIAGTADDLYMTPVRTRDIIQVLVGNDFANHTSDESNPHNVTASQIGAVSTTAYTADMLLKLSTTGTAFDSSRFAGKTEAEFVTQVMALKVADSILFDGRSWTDVLLEITNSTVSNSLTLGGKSAAQIILEAQSGSNFGEVYAGQATFNHPIDVLTNSWTHVGQLKMPQALAVNAEPLTDLVLLVCSASSRDEFQDSIEMLRFTTRNVWGPELMVSQLTPETPLHQYGFNIATDGLTANVWLKSPAGRGQLTVTRLTRGYGTTLALEATVDVEPTSITYVPFTKYITNTDLNHRVTDVATVASVAGVLDLSLVTAGVVKVPLVENITSLILPAGAANKSMQLIIRYVQPVGGAVTVGDWGGAVSVNGEIPIISLVADAYTDVMFENIANTGWVIGTNNTVVENRSAPLVISAATLTLSKTHLNRVLEFTGACVVTIPTDASESWPVDARMELIQAGTGDVEVVVAGGVTLKKESVFQAKTNSQEATIVLQRSAVDVWRLSGSLKLV